MKISQRIIYSGRVQGVGFRYSTKQVATGFDVTGWVRNLDDGTVEMLATGEASEVEAFIEAIASSHLGGYIKEARRNAADVEESTGSGFVVRH